MVAGCVPAGGKSDEVDAEARPEPDATRSLSDGAVLQTDGPDTPGDGAPPPDAADTDAEVADGASPPDGALPDLPGPPPLPECGDGADDDGDGRVDTHDSDCTSPADPRENGDATTPCSNGLDDDEDGEIDFPDDPGCSAAGDPDEADPARVPACDNQEDDDGDGLVDYPRDPGCAGRGDPDEADPPVLPACGNGADDDADGETDYPDDSGCDAAGDDSEVGGCGPDVDVIDLNGHLAANAHYDGTTAGAPALFVGSCGGAAGGERVFGYRVEPGVERLVFSTRHDETASPTVLYLKRRCDAPAELLCDRGVGDLPGTDLVLPRPRPGLYHLFVDTGARDGGGAFRLTVEAIPVPQCRNGVDDDGDDLVDNADPGCVESEDTDEADPDEPPVCANGLDDDGDGFIDHPDDEDCEFAGTEREAPLCPPGAPTLHAGQDGGVFPLPRAEGAGASAGTCDPGIGPEVVVILRLDEASDVTISVTDGGLPADVAVYVRTACRDMDSEIACRRQGQAEALRMEAVAAGAVYVVVEQGFAPPGAMRSVVVAVESILGDCNDEVDNDGDGAIDLADRGCEGLRDQSEVDPADVPQCDDGVDNDEDGDIDYPDDASCVAAGDLHEGGCQGDPLWRPVECQTGEWVWSADRERARDLMTANDLRLLRTGCRHAQDDNDDGLCSLDGTGWVSVDSWPMAGCNVWYHIGGRFSGNCGGHDGDTVRHLVLDEDDCYDYRAQ